MYGYKKERKLTFILIYSLRLSHCLNLNKVKALHALLGCERYFNLLSLRFILNLRDLSEWDNTF